jgi:hypothetical protein
MGCPTPSRLTSGGFEAVRVLIDGAGFADTSVGAVRVQFRFLVPIA